jgi:Methyltransferase domain
MRVTERRLEAGRAEFLVAALEELELGQRRFDKIFAVRVASFTASRERAHELAERWLAPGGAVSALLDSPG